MKNIIVSFGAIVSIVIVSSACGFSVGYCPYGEVQCGQGCMPSGDVCCGETGYCNAGYTCGPNSTCLYDGIGGCFANGEAACPNTDGTVDCAPIGADCCGNHTFCPVGTVCSGNGCVQ